MLHEGSATGWESHTNFERIRGQNPLIHPRKNTNPLIFIAGIQESRTLFDAVAAYPLLHHSPVLWPQLMVSNWQSTALETMLFNITDL